MERKNYLIDTNIAIYYFGAMLTESSMRFLEPLLKSGYCISVINRIELLGFRNLTDAQYDALQSFVSSATVLELHEAVIIETINIRRRYNVKLPDAIVAATCRVNDCCLLTYNIKDFAKIEHLELKTLELN